MEINRGSEWRKWDLHVHTASSYDYNYKGADADQKLIDSLVGNNISAVAITDHFIIDQKRIEALRELAPNIVFFPGVELRTDKGDTNIHVVLIFSEDSNLSLLCENFNVFKRSEGKNSNDDEKVYWDYGSILEFAKKNNAIISIHAGRKSNGIDKRITNSLPHNQAVKEEFASSIDIFEMGQARDFEDYRKFVFPDIGQKKPMIICSDNHDPRLYSSKLWIKAETTFEGLKQIIYEPETRVRIQETKPEEKLGYNVIESIEILDSSFCNQKIYFNQNLNTIIGGRSTGKSTLLKILNYKIQNQSDKRDDYLSEELLNDVSVRWVNAKIGSDPEIEYFSQGYIYDLANNPDEFNAVVRTILKNTKTGRNLLSFESSQEENATTLATKVASAFALNNEIKLAAESIKQIGTSAAILEEIKKIKQLITETSSGEDAQKTIEEYTKLCEEIGVCQKNKKNLEDVRSVLESLRNESNVLSESILNRIDYIVSKTHCLSVKDDFEKFKQGVKSDFDNWINVKFEEVQKAQDKVSSKEKEIREREVYKRGEAYKANSVLFDDLNKKLSIESEKLVNIQFIETERASKINRQAQLIMDTVSLHFNSVDAGNDLCTTLNCQTGELKITATFVLREKELKDFYEDKFHLRSTNNIGVDDFLKSYRSQDRRAFLNNFITKLLNGEYVLKGGKNAQFVASELLGNCWYSINYDVVYQNDRFNEMSPGKQAFVVLKMLLEFSEKKCPILIDQPEDSLDNRAIYSELVGYIKRKKTERQIILVTHNANIVVSADAEQVIVANQHGKDSPNKGGIKFEYATGALEDSRSRNESSVSTLEKQGIREHVCEILEGGRDAFDIREKKYGLKSGF